MMTILRIRYIGRLKNFWLIGNEVSKFAGGTDGNNSHLAPYLISTLQCELKVEPDKVEPCNCHHNRF